MFIVIKMKTKNAEKLLNKLGTLFFISFIVSLILMPWIEGYHLKLFMHSIISFFLCHVCFICQDKIKNTKKI